MKNINPLFIAALVIAAACSKKEDDQKAVQADNKANVTLTSEQMKSVVVKEVNAVPVAEEFTAVGDVSFDENNVVRVFPIVSGTVEKVEVSLGDYVQRGQQLATLLSTDISAYQRDYNVAKANLEVEQKNMTRSEDLYKSGMLSEKDYTEAKKDLANANSEFNEKKQILELYGGSSERLDATFRVVAPRSGYIVERNINEGTQIRTDLNTNIFTISDLKTVWIWANVHESDMAKVKVGDKVSVNTVAYPDKTFEGKIVKIGTMLDPESRVIRVRTELDNQDGLLKPEMFATILITSQTSEKVLAVPEKALVLENNQFYVMKETSANTFEKIKVEVGRKFSEFTEVKGGINAGDRIIVEGSLFALTASNQKS
ncbi:MAG TPA: efflux RND transporter periplasmic adaptor subunit [Cyclobacteriaceae bacterium]|nr:efflux RND transporter periplasmic adaptor subunit [Cyclobacteriaceae bacterium]